MKKKLRNNIVIGLTIGILTAGGGFSVYADSENVDPGSRSLTAELPAQDFGRGVRGKNMMDFSSLVTSGIIDQDTADSMTEYMEQENVGRKVEMVDMKDMTESERQALFKSTKEDQKVDPMTGMVNAGIITQAQADAIKAAMPQREFIGAAGNVSIKVGGRSKMDYSSLVTSGVIDQTVADKISAYIEQKNSDRESEMEKIKAMTESEKQEYLESNKSKEKVDHWAEMVSDGVITQAQADAIKAAKSSDIGRSKMDYSSLVTSGVIDQTTADKISEYMTQKEADKKAKMEEIKAMSESERQAYLESNKDKEKVDLMAEMVSTGIITQTQADAIKAAMPIPSSNKTAE